MLSDKLYKIEEDFDELKEGLIKNQLKLEELEKSVNNITIKLEPIEEELKKFRIAIKIATVVSVLLSLGASLYKVTSLYF